MRHALLGRDVANTEVLFKILSDFDFDKERDVKQSYHRTTSGAAHSSAPQRSAHENVRNVEVTKSPEVRKTSKQKNKNSQINSKAISDASAEIDVLNIVLKDDPCNHACLTPGNGN